MKTKLLAALLLISANSYADPFLNASCKYGIDKGLLVSIAVKESSLRKKAVNRNTDGSEDFCMMQINDYWLDKLPHITRKDIESDVYLCVETGAWVLAQNFVTHGRTWLSVGAYNTGFREDLKTTRDNYIKKVKEIYLTYQQGKFDNKLHSLNSDRHNTSCF